MNPFARRLRAWLCEKVERHFWILLPLALSSLVLICLGHYLQKAGSYGSFLHLVGLGLINEGGMLGLVTFFLLTLIPSWSKH